MIRNDLLSVRRVVLYLASALLLPWPSVLLAMATLDLPSLEARWDATNLTSLESLSSLPDLSGNGWELQFGATPPNHTVNQFGRGALQFDSGLTSLLSTTTQGTNSLFGSTADAEPWAMALGIQYQGSRSSQALGEILGDSDNQLSVRISSDDVDLRTIMPAGPAAIAMQNLPISQGSNIIIVIQHDGVQQSVEVLTDESSWGSGRLESSVPFGRQDAPLTMTAGGNLVLNESQTPLNFYGAAFLQNPTLGEVDNLKAWGASEWLLQGRDQVVLFEGDSTVEVNSAFPERGPSWAQVLHEEYFDSSQVLSQNFAKGGARAIANTQFENGLADSPSAETWDFVVNWLTSAGADVYAPIVMGTNDIGGDGSTPEQVIAALEIWAERTNANGGEAIWLGVLDTQGDPSGQGRTAVNQVIDAGVELGESEFQLSFDALQNDFVWGWGNNVNLTGPQLMADNTHPNTAGNADIAAKLASSFLQLLATPGDFNFDNAVDGIDLSDPTFGWLSRFGADLSGTDFLDWQQNFSVSNLLSSQATAVPEPNSLWLMIACLCLALSCQIRN